MNPTEKAPPFVPAEVHVRTITDEKGALGILSIHTTEGRLDFALDLQAAEAIVSAISAIRSRLDSSERQDKSPTISRAKGPHTAGVLSGRT